MDLFPLFWTSRLQLRTSRKSNRTCPWTSEKNSYFHNPVCLDKISSEFEFGSPRGHKLRH